MPTIKIKVLRDMPNSRNGKVGAAGHHAGDVITVNADTEGTPKSRWWRDRLKDAALDQCCEVVVKKSKPTSTSKSEGDK